MTTLFYQIGTQIENMDFELNKQIWYSFAIERTPGYGCPTKFKWTTSPVNVTARKKGRCCHGNISTDFSGMHSCGISSPARLG
jgi:hypothetical protein